MSIHTARSKGKMIPKALFWDTECHQTSHRIIPTFLFFLLSLNFCLLREAVHLYFRLEVKYFLTASMKPHSKSMTTHFSFFNFFFIIFLPAFLDRRQMWVLFGTKWLFTNLFMYFFLLQPLTSAWQLQTPSTSNQLDRWNPQRQGGCLRCRRLHICGGGGGQARVSISTVRLW